MLLSAEDDLAATIRPRLDAAGADVARVKILRGVTTRETQAGRTLQRSVPLPHNIPDDIPVLEQAIQRAAAQSGVLVAKHPDEPGHIAALQTALARASLPCRALPAEDAVRPGIQTITCLLSRRADGTRGLYIAPRCVHTIAE